jgi:N-acetylmuramoyl-L-alanine amidase
MAAKKIFIDAGHGNNDPGAVSGSRREADDNLRLALAIEPLLRVRGFEIGMTRRTNNFSVGRVQAAVKFKADLYLSLHENAFNDSSAHGFEVVIKMQPSAADIKIAEAVSKRVVAAGVQRDRGILRGVNRGGTVRNLEDLAAIPAGIASVCCEMGFITNTRDMQLIDRNLQQYAQAVVRGVVDVYGAPFPELTAADAMTALRAEAGLETLTPEQAARLDLNGDGKVTSADALAILQIVAGLPL